MGMFTQRPEDDEGAWTALPGEPVEHQDDTDLSRAPAVDPLTLGLGLGLGAGVESIVLPSTATPQAAEEDAGAAPASRDRPRPDAR